MKPASIGFARTISNRLSISLESIEAHIASKWPNYSVSHTRNSQ